MPLVKLDETEMKAVKGGEAITLTGIMALLAIGIVAVTVYKLFFSNEGKASLPGGFSFQWK